MATQQDIQYSILELQSKRSKLGIKKQQLQADISNIKEMLKYVQQGHETFNELVTKRKDLACQSNEIDADLADLKTQIKKRQLLKDEVAISEQPKAVLYEAELTVLRDHYLNFAGDKTRVASMRAMSAEFAESITKLIKRAKAA
jgi:hypothetical protein